MIRYDGDKLKGMARQALRDAAKDLYGVRRARLEGWHIQHKTGMDYIVLVAEGSVKVPNAARTGFTADGGDMTIAILTLIVFGGYMILGRWWDKVARSTTVPQREADVLRAVVEPLEGDSAPPRGEPDIYRDHDGIMYVVIDDDGQQQSPFYLRAKRAREWREDYGDRAKDWRVVVVGYRVFAEDPTIEDDPTGRRPHGYSYLERHAP